MAKVGNLVRASKVDPKRKKALAARKPGEHVLLTIDGASSTVKVGEVFPCSAADRMTRRLYEVVRTNVEIDAVYAREIVSMDLPWWKYNIMKAKGVVDESCLTYA